MLLVLKVAELEEENRKLKEELRLQHEPKINKGSPRILMDDFKDSCRARKIRLTLDLTANRVRYFFKTQKGKKYRRIDFKMQVNQETLYGRTDQLVRDIADWVQDHDWSHNSRGFSYYLRYLNFEDKFLICQ